MAGRTLTVFLAADTTKFRQGMTGAQQSMKGLDDGIGGTANKLTSMLGPALAGAAVAAGAYAVKLGVDGVKAAIDDEAAASKLAQTLENLNLAHDTTAVEAMIDALQRQTGVADDELRPAFGRLAVALKDTDLATDALELAMDISAGTGKDLDTVVQALAKAYEGNTGALTRLGVGLDRQIVKTGDMDLITQELAKTFDGQAEKAAGTYQGSIDRLTVGFGELQESFGAGFLEGLGNADNKTGDLMDTMKEFESELGDLGETIGQIVTGLGDLAVFLKDSQDAVKDFTDSMGPAGKALGPFINPLEKILDILNGIPRAVSIAQGAIDSLRGPKPGLLDIAGGVLR